MITKLSRIVHIDASVEHRIKLESLELLKTYLLGGGGKSQLGQFQDTVKALSESASAQKIPSSEDPPETNEELPDDTGLRVAVAINGSLGDILQQAPVVSHFHKTYAPEVIDIYLDGKKMDDRSVLVARALPFIRRIDAKDSLQAHIDNNAYDLLIEGRHIVKYTPLDEKRIRRRFPEVASLVAKAQNRFKPLEFIFDNHPRLDGLFGRFMARHGLNATQAAGYFAGFSLPRDAVADIKPAEDEQLAARTACDATEYITVHDGFDPDKKVIGGGRPTRAWPLEHWRRLVELIKAQYPGIKIVQIGDSATSSEIPGVDINLLDKISLLTACAVIRDSKLHIDGESGLIRVAAAMKTPTLSIQGPSASLFFQFGDNITVDSSSVCSSCWWVTDDWFSHCARGLDRAECMYSIIPEIAFNEVDKIL